MLAVMLMMALVPLSVHGVNPQLKCDAANLYTQGYVTLSFDTFNETWDPDIYMDHNDWQNYIKLTTKDNTTVDIATMKVVEYSDRKFQLRSTNGFRIVNELNSKQVSNNNNFVVFDGRNEVLDKHWYGDSYWTYAKIRVYIPAKYILEGFTLNLRIYYERKGDYSDSGYWYGKWELGGNKDYATTDCNVTLEQKTHPGYFRFSWAEKKSFAPEQYIYFTDENGSKITINDEDSYRAGAVGSKYAEISENNKHAVYELSGKYSAVYFPISNKPRKITPHLLTSFLGNSIAYNVKETNLLSQSSQISSIYTDSIEGSIEAMVDGNGSTFWHSDWHGGSVKPGTHYFDVDLLHEEIGDIKVTVQRRNTKNDHITELGVYARNDTTSSWQFIKRLKLPYEKQGEFRDAGFTLEHKCRYLRFVINATTTGNGFSHLSQFQLKKVDADMIYDKNYTDVTDLGTFNVPAYSWPNEIVADFDTVNGKIVLNWNIPTEGLSSSNTIVEEDEDDGFLLRREWIDYKGDLVGKNIGRVPYKCTTSSYKLSDDISNVKINGGLTYKLRRQYTNSFWSWDYCTEKPIDYVSKLMSFSNFAVCVDDSTYKDVCAKITWDYEEGSWPANSKLEFYTDDGYDIVEAFVIDKKSNAEKGVYYDRDFCGCGKIQYYVRFVPGSRDYLYDVEAGEEVDPEKIAIGEPLLYTKIGTLSNIKSSKGYYNDRVNLSFDVNGELDEFRIYRTIYGGNLESADSLICIKSEQGKRKITYTDKDNLNPGAYYTYYIVGAKQCGKNWLLTEPFSTVGFATSTGTIYGQVTFTSGAAEPGVIVYTESKNDDELSGKSIKLPGTEGGYLKVDKTIELDSAFVLQAYVEPLSDGYIFKLDDKTTLDYSGGKYVFNAGGKSVSASRNTGNGNVFEHITAMLSNNTLKLYVNGVLKATAEGAKYDSIKANIIIGQNMMGLVDEVRVWNKTLSDEEIARDYNRYLHGAEKGLVAYWRFNDGIDGEFYDLAHDKNNTYYQNDGVFVGEVGYSEDVPKPDQLAFKGVTDETGYYMISGIPYTGNGTMYTIRASKDNHEFTYGNNSSSVAQRLVSQDSKNHQVDMVDNSSFNVSGFVYYAGGTVPSPNVMFKVDGVVQYDKEGQSITTDSEGRFTISVPVGVHKVQAFLENHTFELDGKITDMDGSDRTYQDDVENIHLYDNTRVRFVGRVAGGTVQEAYPVGHSLSTNNLGENITLNLTLKSEEGKYHISENDTTFVVKHQRVLHLKDVKEDELPQTTVKTGKISITITADKNTGEFVADLLPLDYIITGVNVSGHNNLLSSSESLDLRKEFFENYAENTNEIQDKDGNVIESRLDSVFYNYQQLFIKRTTPIIEISQVNARTGRLLDYFGDATKTIDNTDGTEMEVDLYNSDTHEYMFGYPVFSSNVLYRMNVYAYEPYQYYNAKGDAVETRIDKVAISDGLMTFENDLSFSSYTDTLSLDAKGHADYKFTCDSPDISANGPLKNMFVKLDSNDATILWNGGHPMECIVVGSRSEGQRFVTKGPDRLSFILRDPPGSNSSATMASGFTTVQTSSYSWSLDNEGSETSSWDVGTKIATVTMSPPSPVSGTQAGVISKNEATHDFSVGIIHGEGGGNEKSSTMTKTYNCEYSTSDSENFVGADGDLFVGNSTNINYGPAVNVRIIPAKSFSSSSMEKIKETADGALYLIKDQGMSFNIEYDTEFEYTQKMIEEDMIPRWIEMRNSKLDPYTLDDATAQSKATNLHRPVYRSEVPEDDEEYGKKYKVFWPMTLSFDGKLVPVVSADSVELCNNSIYIWTGYLEQNEREKVLAKPISTFSFSGGASKTIEDSYAIAATKTRQFSFTIGANYGNEFNVDMSAFGVALGNKLTIDESITTTESWSSGTEYENSNTITITLDDGDSDDEFAVEICKYEPWSYLSDKEKKKLEEDLTEYSFDNYSQEYKQSNNLDLLHGKQGSYVYRLLGGETSCPYEGGYIAKYYEPNKKHVIDIATVPIEVPRISASPETPTTITKIPQGNYAFVTVNLSNATASTKEGNFLLYLDETSNPYGVVATVGGTSIMSKQNGVPYTLTKSDSQTATVRFERGVANDYSNLKLVLASDCDDNAYAELPITLKWQKSTSDVEIASPANNWILNTSDYFVDEYGEYQLPVNIKNFDINSVGFQYVALQYKPSSSSDNKWVSVCKFYSTTEAFNNAQGVKEMIPTDRDDIMYYMNMQTLTDGYYDLRAAAVAIIDGVETTRYSEIMSGIKDTRRPSLFGKIEPADGVLNFTDDIKLKFNETINGEIMTDSKFEVKGKKLGENLSRTASVRFDGVNDCLTTEAETNLNGKDFTIETNIYIDALDHNATFFSLGTPGKAFEVGMNTEKKLTVKSEGKSYTSSEPIDVLPEQWEHLGIIYTDHNHNIAAYYNGNPVWHCEIEKPTAKGVFTIGSDCEGKNGFCGKMSELRIWNRERSGEQLETYKNKSIAANQVGLLSYYPMDEGRGSMVKDKARGANAYMMDAQWFINRDGYAARLKTDNVPALTIPTSRIPLSTDNDFTLEFWFRGAKGQKNVALFSNGQAEDEPSAKDHMTIGFNEEGKLHVKTVTNDHVSNLTSAELLDDAWHHLALAVERNAGTAKLYVDGVFDSYFASTKIRTLASAYATFGCRTVIPNDPGQVSQNSYSYDQALDGSVDEIRLWNFAVNSTMLEEQSNTALSGKELGLLAYYPFERYYEWQGTNELKYSAEDWTTLLEAKEEDRNVATGSATETKDTAPIKEAGSDNTIMINWSVNNDEMIITPYAGNWNAYDLSTLTYKITDIRDMHGNEIQSPIVFSLQIDQSPLKWEKKEMNIVVPSGEGGEFTVDIENLYGGSQSYTIENQPSWLGVSTASGQLASKDSKHIKFTIDRALNTGSYTETVYLVNGDGLARPLNINIKVKGEGPDWNVNPSNYAYSMNIIGQLKIDGELSSDGEDMIAAFSGDECVGVATNRYNASKGLYYTFLSVYSNASAGTEPLTFRVWDASTGKITIGKPSIGDIIFKSDDVKGSISEPVEFVNTDAISEKYELTSGWNWVSFNLELGADEASSVIANGMWSSGDEIKNARYVDSYSTSQNGWIGTLSNHGGLNNTELFKLKVKNGQTVVVEGKPVDVTKTSISVKQGWNYISYLPTTLMTLKDALASYDASAGDVIKSQTGFAQYDNNNGWVGNVDYLSPSKGYMLKRTASSSSSFKYPSYSSTSHSAQRHKTRSVMTEAEEGEHYFSSNMNVIATIEGIELQDNDELVASVRGERRSYTDRIAYNDQSLWFVTIEGEEVAPIIFTVERDGKPIASTRSVFDYHNDDIRGTLQTPTVINFTSLSDDVNVSPRLFKSQFTVSLDKPVINNLKVEVYSVTGQLVLHDKALNVQGAYSHTFDGSALTNGVYLVRVIVDGEPTIIRIVKH